MAALHSFWGASKGSIEWCEQNYAVSPYIAEFWNCITNIPMIILAGIGLASAIRQRFEKRFSILWLMMVTIGIGSALFHATLKHVQQQSDETPMVWAILVYIYVLFSPDWHYTNAMPIFLFLYGTCFAIIHSQFRFVIGFQIHYAFLVSLCLPRMYKYYLHCNSPVAQHVAELYIYTLILGVACWLVDRSFCDLLQSFPVNPQGHAWWHVFMGFNSYYGITFLEYCRASQLRWNPTVVYWWGLPYVHVKKGAAREQAVSNGLSKVD
ncbi:Ceramidase [Klebsormidium nitens]|uniref:Ceramidase n=1 Tax=Klebsormidium nitens TaxID=105231 RepID=A0A0U9I6P4_KLENI|nr:Ceramidase [Klebsormidium nitens]|eukprot:GAQ80572.1 Ceramidase [Klebsormidium nitens]